MALVSYEYSSGSENEITDEEDDSTRVVVNGANKRNIELQPLSASSSTSTDPLAFHVETSSQLGTSNLFHNLPESKTSSPQITEDDKLEDFIPTVNSIKTKKKVQITIPSLSDFNDLKDEEPQIKRVKPSQRGSGLLGILPPIKNTPISNTSFIPNTIKSKNIPTKTLNTTGSSSKNLIPHSVRKNAEAKSTNKHKTKTDKDKTDSDSDEDLQVPETFDDQMWEKVCGRPKCSPRIEVDERLQEEPEMQPNIAPEPVQPYEGLDNKAFKELVGKSKRPIGNIKLVDINEEEILPDKDLWMTKSLTDPEMAPRAVADDSVDPTKKRKHHITYLAQQAKANEQELKSAWAASRSNRMMSRSKYGF